MSKIAARVAVGLAVTTAVLVAGAFFWLKSSAPSLNGKLVVAGLSDNVSIVRDEYGVPHIFAETQGDAYTALGFAHAQDRLVQMEFLRWVAQGRLAAKVGAGGIETDKLSRTLNLKKIGEISHARADAETIRSLQQYADGVNAYIASHKGAWPLEFVMLGAQPEPWTVSDIFSLSGLILFALPDWQDELVRAKFSSRLSPDQMQDFFPPYPENAPVTYSASVSPPTAPEDASRTNAIRHAGWPFVKGGFASNTWAVHGSHTKSGLPLLASDPHGGFTAPIDYYLARISGPGFSMRGVGSPGFPAFLSGHNDRIAWGLTDIGADVTDLFLERGLDAQTYEGPSGPLPFKTRTEVIKVKGGEDVVLAVRETRHGPVISDVHQGAKEYADGFGKDYAVSLSAEAFTRGVSFTAAMMQANKAQNWEQFITAMKDYDFQHNFSYADRNGNIGMVSAARLPDRNDAGSHTPRKGWLEENDWSKAIPVASILHEQNPARGFIANANNRLTPAGSSFEASSSPSPQYRITRITELLSLTKDHDVETMMKAQSDVLSLAARELLPLMTVIKGDSKEAQKAIAMLRAWDGEMTTERPEPLIYAAWVKEMSALVFSDELGALYKEWKAPREHSLARILQNHEEWCDNGATDPEKVCNALLGDALDSALSKLITSYGGDMEEWAYGEAHKARYTHQIFSGVPVLASLSEASAAVGGDDRTVNAASVSYDEDTPFQATSGARYRQIIDLSDLDNSRFILAPGVSGNVFSPYYKNLTAKWARAEYITLAGDKNAVVKRGVGVIELFPE